MPAGPRCVIVQEIARLLRQIVTIDIGIIMDEFVVLL